MKAYIITEIVDGNQIYQRMILDKNEALNFAVQIAFENIDANENPSLLYKDISDERKAEIRAELEDDGNMIADDYVLYLKELDTDNV
jgi:U3 small nucleolar ribonucleoprotein component